MPTLYNFSSILSNCSGQLIYRTIAFYFDLLNLSALLPEGFLPILVVVKEMAQESRLWNNILKLNYSLVRWQQGTFFNSKWKE